MAAMRHIAAHTFIEGQTGPKSQANVGKNRQVFRQKYQELEYF
jgi:hypothetical protein